MMNVDDPPILEASPLTEADERLIQRVSEIETASIDRLTDGGKRLVEWGTAAISIFFASLALLENPNVLAAFQSGSSKGFGILAVLAYIIAILCGFFVSLPMRYTIHRHNLKAMQNELKKIFDDKFRLLVGGSLAFVSGSIMLGLVIINVLMSIE